MVESKVQSWLGVYKGKADVSTVSDLEELKSTLKKGNFYSIGDSHSYNGIQISQGSSSVDFIRSNLKKMTYDECTHEVTVEASVTILELKTFLDTKGRRVLNSGNFMEQTVVAGLITGTHGYGEFSVMADSIVSLTILDGQGREIEYLQSSPEFKFVALSFGVICPIIRMVLRTAPVSQYEVTSKLCKLSQLKEFTKDSIGVSYGIFPYSGDDPTIALNVQREVKEEMPITADPHSFPLQTYFLHWFVPHYWMFSDSHPMLRVFIQKQIKRFAEGRVSRVVYTDPLDLDYLYDPYPLIRDHRPPGIANLFKNAYRSYNVSFFVPQEKLNEVVTFLLSYVKDQMRFGFYLNNLIGIRELKGKSDLVFAGNYHGATSAIDLFCAPKEYPFLLELQRTVQLKFDDVRPHFGKSLIDSSWRKSLGADNLDYLKELHLALYGKKTISLPNGTRDLLHF